MKRKNTRILLSLACVLALLGCEKAEPVVNTEPVETEPIVLATAPADGNPGDVTCKGMYSESPEAIDRDAVVATAGDARLTNGQLAVWYHAAIAQYAQEEHAEAPDFQADLPMQVCEPDDSVNSWQQYFLREALDNWHAAQALEIASRTDPIVKEAAYKPTEGHIEKYMTGMPVTDVLYGYNDYYKPNSMHRAYLDGIPQMLETLAKDRGYASAEKMAEEAFGAKLADLEAAVRLYNYGYMYFTQLGYTEIPEEITEESQPVSQGERYVDIRHILLVPRNITDKKGNVTDPVEIGEDGTVICSEAVWEKNDARAKKLLKEWKKKYSKSEKGFRELAFYNSDDAASSENGGIYRQLRQGQLIEALDAWCFDESRQVGDVTTIRTEYGHHILYFAGSKAAADVQAEQEAKAREKQEMIAEMKERFPARIDYGKIQLPRAEASVAFGEVLYPDVAHERYPEVPLYLQQVYEGVKFGHDLLRSHGCGITTFSMLSSYMMDEEYTPPEMCAQFGRYSYGNGTDGMLYINEPSTLGYYLLEKTYEPKRVKEALTEGNIVISIQHPGYWTRGGHYIMLEKMTEDGMIQVRDSNIFNYSRIKNHAQDKHGLQDIFAHGSGYWVFQKKVTAIPFCCRCGDGQGASEILQTEDYLCEKCETALLRRNTWLEG